MGGDEEKSRPWERFQKKKREERRERAGVGERGEAIDGAEVAGDVDRNEEEVGGEGIEGAD
ncbi:hypothetical protein DsansV1_C04g0037361 [Dioscorea sansibarensis]